MLNNKNYMPTRNEWPNISDEFKLFSIKNKLSLIHVIHTIIKKLHIWYITIFIYTYIKSMALLAYTFYMDNVNITKYYYTFYYARIPYIRSVINVNLMDVSKHVLFYYIIIILLIFFHTNDINKWRCSRGWTDGGGWPDVRTQARKKTFSAATRAVNTTGRSSVFPGVDCTHVNRTVMIYLTLLSAGTDYTMFPAVAAVV